MTKQGKSSAQKKCEEFVLQLHGGRCVVCLEPANHIHHLRPKSLFKKGTSDPDNMVPLCLVCHEKVHTKGTTTEWAKILKQRSINVREIFS